LSVNPDITPTIIEPTRGWVSLRLKDFWEYRDLLYFLAWRDIKVKYKQTLLGASWAIIQPFTTMVVFSLFFGRLAAIQSDGIPYPIFSFTALIPWTFFSNGLTQSSNSLVNSANLLKKVYFPRMIMPTAGVLVGIPDALLSFSILFLMMLFYGIHPNWAAFLWLPILFLLALSTSLGTGLGLSALNVEYRDIRYVTPFLTQLWLYVTPIAYPTSLIQNPVLRAIYSLNPMVGVVDGFRWVLLGTGTQLDPSLIISWFVSFVILITGMFYFRRMEKKFADLA
jgi:lipopolysaccharide transport system permease protein